MKTTQRSEPEIRPNPDGVRMAPFETFHDHRVRSESESPYNAEFIERCREKASEYDKENVFLRTDSLRSLSRCVPFHFRSRVFDGIAFDED